MKRFYQVLAYVIAGLVVVQAMAVVWALSGESKYVSNGGVIDKAVVESREFIFPEVLGFAVHGINGGMVIPLVAVLLLVASFFAELPGAVKWGAAVFVLVLAQTSLGYASHEIPITGALHGLNALLLFTAAGYTGLRVKRIASVGV
jgi:hypothetical protein